MSILGWGGLFYCMSLILANSKGDTTVTSSLLWKKKKLEIFGGHLLSEDDHSHWVPPYWNIMKKAFSLGRTEV